MKQLLLLSCLFITQFSFAQNKFQKVYLWNGAAMCLSSNLNQDGSFVFTGIVNTNGVDRLYLTKANCQGDLLWTRTYELSSSIGNISQRVIENYDGSYTLAANMGSFNAYDIVVIKTDADGNAVWKKKIGGSGDDLVNTIIQTADSGFALAGYTNTYGQDVGTGYRDVYLVKLDKNGVIQWTKTYGNHNTIDEAFDIVGTGDGGFALTGRYITSEAFHAFLLKTDSVGGVEYLKAYGDSNQNTTGYSIIRTPDNGYAITGSTTVLKPNFQSYGDVFLVKTNSQGDTSWCRAYWSNNTDGDDIGSSVVFDQNQYTVSNATFGYPTTGFVPNKYCAMQFSNVGLLIKAVLYMDGSSHYPYLSKAIDQQNYIISGFSNLYTADFNPLIVRTDKSLSSGCNETDVTNITGQSHVPFKVKTPPFLLGSGGTESDLSYEDSIQFTINTLCETIVDTCTIVHDTTTDTTDTLGTFIINRHLQPFRIFPNPANKVLFFDADAATADHFDLEVYDAAGRLVIEHEFKVGDHFIGQLDISKLSDGIYFIRCVYADRIYETKFIKQGNQ